MASSLFALLGLAGSTGAMFSGPGISLALIGLSFLLLGLSFYRIYILKRGDAKDKKIAWLSATIVLSLAIFRIYRIYRGS